MSSYSMLMSTAPLVESEKETEEASYLLWRLENGVAEGSTEIPKGASFCMLLYLDYHYFFR